MQGNMKIETIGIIGQGALGIMYGNHLAKRLGSERVFFIADPFRTVRYRKEGAVCNGETCNFTYRSPEETVKADLIIFAVKFMGLREAVETVRPFVGRDTLLLSVLNGISSEKMLEESFGAGHVLYACVQGMDAGKKGNAVSYQNMGYISVGNKDKSHDERLAAVTALFDEAGLRYETPEDIIREQWNKLMLNEGVNQVTAVCQIPYGGIQEDGEARIMMIEAMKEVRRAAASEGVTLTDGDIERWLKLLDGLDPKGRTSMCQDVEAGRKTELELFAGTILGICKEAGIQAPVNEFLYERLTELNHAAEQA